MAEYTPSEAEFRTALHDMIANGSDPAPEDWTAERTAEFDRFLARVRRDAARERFEDFIANVQTMHDGTHLHAGRIVYAEVIRLAEVYVKHQLPETEDQT